jgi:hypothetical protein
MMRSHWPATIGTAAIFLVFIIVVAVQLSPSLNKSATIKALMEARCSPAPVPELNPRGATYLMMLHFKDQAPVDSIYRTANATMALKHKCTHPVTKDPYIRSIRGGKNNADSQDAVGPDKHRLPIYTRH